MAIHRRGDHATYGVKPPMSRCTAHSTRTGKRCKKAAIREALDLLDRIAGWPADDWQGLKFHAFELARRLRSEA